MPGLSVVKVSALVRKGKRGRHADGGGLYLAVQPSATGGARGHWCFRWRRWDPGKGKHRLREMGLGSIDVVTLAEAREAALDARRIIREGGDPIAARDADDAGERSFAAVAAAYIEAHGPSWRNAKHRAQWSATLEAYVFPRIGPAAVSAVSTEDVVALLTPIWLTKKETARRIRGRIESVLDYATSRGWRVGDNPARLRGHLQHLLPKQAADNRHHAAMPWSDLPKFIKLLRRSPGLGARALEFTILTAARTSETLDATWSEIDLDGAVWTIPAKRMKAGRDHRVPLSPAALGVLKTVRPLRRADDFIFPGAANMRPLSNMAMAMTLRRLEKGHFTAHGFRSSFKDWASEVTHFPNIVSEMALAHSIDSKVEAAYRRGDLFEKRRELMAAWAAYIWPAKSARKTGSVRKR